MDDPLAAIEQFWSDTHARHAMVRGDRANPVLPPHDLFLTTDGFFGAIAFPRVELTTHPLSNECPQLLPPRWGRHHNNSFPSLTGKVGMGVICNDADDTLNFTQPSPSRRDIQ
jgi:transcription-repair coupling factor (superfamily II helicase)